MPLIDDYFSSSDELERHEEYFLNLVNHLLSAYKVILRHFLQKNLPQLACSQEDALSLFEFNLSLFHLG